jgi:hypothetical protein
LGNSKASTSTNSPPAKTNAETLAVETPCENNEAFITDLKKLIRYMCNGLTKLQNTYHYGNVVLAIQYYINLLDDGLNGIFNPQRLPNCLLEDLWIDSPLKIKVFAIWNYERLHRVCTSFDACFAEATQNSKIKDKLIAHYISSIEGILSTYEEEFNNRIERWG